jgi:hypothetical protein
MIGKAALAIAIAAALGGCAYQPAHRAMQPDPGPTLAECLVMIHRETVFVEVSTKAINECLQTRKGDVSGACSAIPLWMAMHDEKVGGNREQLMTCAQLIDAAGVPVSRDYIRSGEAFREAVDKYVRRMQ